MSGDFRKLRLVNKLLKNCRLVDQTDIYFSILKDDKIVIRLKLQFNQSLALWSTYA